MQEMLLEFHDWRRMKADDDNELVVLFLFSLMPADERQAGRQPDHNDCFWIEVKLSRFLAEQPGWKGLSRADKVKAMFQFALEQIQAAKRKLRQAALVWTSGGRLNHGPPWDLASIRFPKAPPVIVEAEEPQASRFLARKAAGLAG
jgi:hypothetical protein